MNDTNKSRPPVSRALLTVAIAIAAIFYAAVMTMLAFGGLSFDEQSLLVAIATMVATFCAALAALAAMAVFVTGEVGPR